MFCNISSPEFTANDVQFYIFTLSQDHPIHAQGEAHPNHPKTAMQTTEKQPQSGEHL